MLGEETVQPKQPQVKKKPTRSDRLQINSSKNITDKHRLENQITRIIK